MSDARPTADVPTSIGRYRIDAHLATDPLDVVYRGFDPLIERPVVVKVFPLQLDAGIAQATVTETFYRELQRVGGLTHEAITTLYDAGEIPGAFFMASEFVDGPALTEFLAERPDLDLPMRVWIISQIVDALEYARDQGVAHLNLKPTNVIVGSDGAVKLGGFGVAPILDAIAPRAGGLVAPKSRYAAPERARGEAGDFRSDVYSLAELAKDVLSGFEPTEDGGRLADVFARALADDPGQRYSTAALLKFELLLLFEVDEAQARVAWEEHTGLDQSGTDAASGDRTTSAFIPAFHTMSPDATTAAATPAPGADSETIMRVDSGDQPTRETARPASVPGRRPVG